MFQNFRRGVRAGDEMYYQTVMYNKEIILFYVNTRERNKII